MRNMIKELRYIFNRKQKIGFCILVLISIVGTFLELAGVTVILPFINVVMSPNTIHRKWYLQWIYEKGNFQTDTSFIVFVAAVLMFVYIVKNVYLCFMYNMQYKFSYDNQRRIATKMLHVYLMQPYSFHRVHSSSELMRNIMTDTERMFQGVLAILQLITESCVCLVLGIYLFIMDKTITLGVVLMVGLFLLVFTKGYKNYLGYIGNESRKYAAQLTKWIQQAFGGIKESKILERESYFLEKYDYNYKNRAFTDRQYRFLQVLPRPVMETVCVSALMLVIIFKLLKGTSSTYFVSTVSIFAIAAFRLLPSINRIANYIGQLSYSKASIHLVYRDLKEINNMKQVERKEKHAERLKICKSICVDGLSFRYPDADKDVLTDVKLEIKKNQSVALIGPSGAGKTTLADILLGLMEPEKGGVYVDEINIQTNLSGWHKNIGYIPQTIYLMDASIKENIAFGIRTEDINEELLKKAIEYAQLKEFVSGLPEGVDTVIGESGIRLSGGQRQRIGIARALYSDPEVLVLDEATSALDNETEKAVMDAIDSLAGKKTMIIIAHRLTTIKNCDLIFEVKDSGVKQVNLEFE